MKRASQTIAICTLIGLMIVLIVFAPSYGTHLRSFFSPNLGTADIASIALQNEALKADLAKLQNIADQLPHKPSGYIRGMVYSRYPFDLKNELVVDVGSNGGVKQGAPAVFGGVFVGTVERVFAESALVETIFDNNFKMPMRIGTKGYDGLLQGGPSPTVVSIAKNAVVGKGDIIYTAAPGVEYGLPVGEVSSVNASPDGLFQEATFTVSYEVNDLRTITIASSE